MSACVADGLPPRLPANSSRACVAGERQHARIDQRVVHDHVGLRQAGERIEREQAGIARPGAREPDVARREDRHAAAPRRERVPCGHGRLPLIRASAETAAVIGIVERAVAKIFGGERAADQDQRGALDRAAATCAAMSASVPRRSAASGVLACVRRPLPGSRRHRTARVLSRSLSMAWMARWMTSVAPLAANVASFSFSGMREARPRHARQHHALRDFRHGQLAFQRRRGGGESRHAGRERIRNAAALETAKLFGERAE